MQRDATGHDIVALFDRNGVAPTSTVQYDEKGKPFFMMERKCGRCGGEGKSDRWAYTGLTCYDCNGSGKHKNGPVATRLYTAVENTKLNVIRDRQRAIKAAKAEAQRLAAEKRAADLRGEFQAQHGDLIKRAYDYLVERFGWDAEAEEVAYEARGHFVHQIIGRAERQSEISQAQVDAVETELARFAAEKAAKAASTWVGKIGEKVAATVTVIVATSFERPRFNASWIKETVFVRVLRDEAGNTFKVMAGNFSPRKGAVLKITGKVKKHDVYKDEKQTVLNFVKVKEVIASGESEEGE